LNFYKHHLGDYANATAHLSWEEDCAYSRLLRAYYTREKPIHADEIYRIVRAVSKNQRAAVQVVLKEFFTIINNEWHNKRADEEIAAYQAQARTNKQIAKNRWKNESHTNRTKEAPTESNANRIRIVNESIT